jgi:dipeptidyl aminopeptidase/acylaminoacyl peptidase
MKNRVLLALLVCSIFALADAGKPKLTLDEFFNWVEIDSVQLSPDGNSVVIQTDRADWDQSIFRDDLWLYRDDQGSGTLVQLTQSGHDRSPQWSPDGHWIAFLSTRKAPSAKDNDSGSDDKDDEKAQLYLISPSGGEAFAVTNGDEAVHSFAWSPDSRTLYFATRQPWTKAQTDAYKKEWKDVIQYRAAERGDIIFSIDVADAVARHAAPAKSTENSEGNGATPGARPLGNSSLRVTELIASPDGRRLAFLSSSISQREEKIEQFEIYSVDLATASPTQPPRQLTHNQAQEQNLHWSKDSKDVFFLVQYGSVEGKYKDRQVRLYSVDADTGETQRWASNFSGAVLGYSVAPDGGIVADGRIGTEVQVYSQQKASEPFSKANGVPGTYELVATALNSPRIACVHSTIEHPNEVYVADSLSKLSDAHAITSFNQLFTQRDLPKAKPYHWKADDGTPIEGMLMYPPGKFEDKNLPMFLFIHGGPDDADGNHFEADWYVWDRLAATQGWLVFEPNYRGSIGYGDKFMSDAVPGMESVPGKDILAGVDALVRDGIADPEHLAIGGYSAGGYLVNWLITQTTRFKAAVTGAGAVENVSNWGNDDTTFDDSYYLGGTPWNARQNYDDQAAIFQINKVRTPTHIVVGADDIRVAADEAYLLDHALYNLGVPSDFLIFPGEGHDLGKNPWHGKIKVREELKWLQKYGGVGNTQ